MNGVLKYGGGAGVQAKVRGEENLILHRNQHVQCGVLHGGNAMKLWSEKMGFWLIVERYLNVLIA